MALLVSIALFAYCWLIGFALLGVLGRRDDLIRNVLIAPATGMALLVYVIYVPCRAGLVLGTVALPVTLLLFVLAVAALAWRRPWLPGRRALPYLVLLPLAFLTCGWPLLQDGFAWFSNFNPDAGQYMLDTKRLVQHSYFELTDAAQWRDRSNWAAYYIAFPASQQRSATDLVFGWAVVLTGLDEPALYMPLILSWHIAALAAGAALIGTAERFARLLSAALLVTAAMSIIGVTNQLMGQEFGVPILALSAMQLLTPFYRLAWPALLRHVLLTGLVMASFLLSYPELTPFLGLGFFLYHGRSALDVLRHWRKAVPAGLAIGAVAAVLIAPNALDTVHFLVGQATAAATKMQYADLFPYLIVPSGAAALWGLGVFSNGTSVVLSPGVAISIGFALTATAIPAALWLVWQRAAVAAIVTIMLGLAAAMLANNVGFGMFKLAMYMQCFLLPMMVLAVCRLLRVAR